MKSQFGVLHGRPCHSQGPYTINIVLPLQYDAFRKHPKSHIIDIILFRFITMFYGTDNIPGSIYYIQTECVEGFGDHCLSQRTLLWI